MLMYRMGVACPETPISSIGSWQDTLNRLGRPLGVLRLRIWNMEHVRVAGILDDGYVMLDDREAGGASIPLVGFTSTFTKYNHLSRRC